MSKRTKKKWIKTLTQKDKNMLKAFSNVGYLKKEMLTQDLKMADNRIKNFKRDGYIEEKDYLDKNTKNMERVLTLTEKGKRMIGEEMEVRFFYKSNSPSHDLALAKRYLAEPQENRNNWINENEVRAQFINQLEELRDTNFGRYEEIKTRFDNGELSPPDGLVRLSTGTVIAIEVITAAYRPADKQAKVDFCTTIGVDLEMERG